MPTPWYTFLSQMWYNSTFCQWLSNYCEHHLLYRIQGASMMAQTVEPVCNAGDPGSSPGSGWSPGDGNGNPLQYSSKRILEQRSLAGSVHGVAKSRTRPSDYTLTRGSFERRRRNKPRKEPTTGQPDPAAALQASCTVLRPPQTRRN